MSKSAWWKEMMWSLAAGNALVPFGDNGVVVRRLSERIAAARAEEAAKTARADSLGPLDSPRGRKPVSAA